MDPCRKGFSDQGDPSPLDLSKGRISVSPPPVPVSSPLIYHIMCIYFLLSFPPFLYLPLCLLQQYEYKSHCIPHIGNKTSLPLQHLAFFCVLLLLHIIRKHGNKGTGTLQPHPGFIFASCCQSGLTQFWPD